MKQDVVIVGAGPSGLSAGIFTTSEGLKTAIIEHGYIGGQSSASSLVVNYYGFPDGISGGDLAERGREQAIKLGAQIIRDNVDHLEPMAVAPDASHEDRRNMPAPNLSHWRVHLQSGSYIEATVVILACGLTFRQLSVPHHDNPAVYYGPHAEVYEQCIGKTVAVVGAGNGAGQAADKLAELGCPVVLLVRGDNLEASMSEYLIERIKAKPKDITVRYRAVIEAFKVADDGRLTAITLDSDEVQAAACFIFIGMEPDTKWCRDYCAVDDRGFVVINEHFETSAPGIYAIGDVHEHARSRIAAAVGEGSIVVQYVHEFINKRQLVAAHAGA